jgi:trehalose 6-phosphate phosphatase
MVDVDTPPRFSRLPEPLVGALREIARTPKLLVALDFDGTLAPEVDDPERARASGSARAAVLRLLSMPNTRVALVSGRALDSLERVSELPDNALLIGSHGIEIRLDGPEDGFALSSKEQLNFEVLHDVLAEVADSIDNVWLEPKPAGFALHTRLATEENSRVAHLVARKETAAEISGLTVRDGKNVLERQRAKPSNTCANTRLRPRFSSLETM